jgi:hypothetical protein
LPAPQFTHASAAAAEYIPGTQTVQDVAPVSTWKCPALQFSQVDHPAVGWKVP